MFPNLFLCLLRSLKINLYIYQNFLIMSNGNLFYNVSRILKEKRMQQKDLAQKLGKTPAFISNTLSGNPTLETLQSIASALSVPVSTLLRDEKDIYGVVEVHGEEYHIDSWEDIYKLIEKHERAIKKNTF